MEGGAFFNMSGAFWEIGQEELNLSNTASGRNRDAGRSVLEEDGLLESKSQFRRKKGLLSEGPTEVKGVFVRTAPSRPERRSLEIVTQP